jgi:anti-anti-sigma factor
METSSTLENGITMVTVSGNVDIAGSEILEAALNQHLNDGVSKLVLDLSDVGFVSSSGLRVLLKTAQSLQRSEGRMRLCEANETVREIFGISGFDKILEIAGSREEALTGMD